MVALFLDDNKTNADGDGKKIGKINMFVLTNNNLARASCCFVISLPLLHHCNMKLSYFMSLLYGVGEHNRQIVASVF